jgi:hypothetical protein
VYQYKDQQDPYKIKDQNPRIWNIVGQLRFVFKIQLKIKADLQQTNKQHCTIYSYQIIGISWFNIALRGERAHVNI